MEVDHQLLARIRSACNREASLSIGIAHEIVAQTQFLARLHAEERAAESRLRAWPDHPGRGALTPDQRNDASNAQAEERNALRHVEKIAGPPIREQAAMQRHVDAVRSAGGNVDVATQQFAAASGGVDQQALQTSWEQAIQARVRAERALADLEQERSHLGRRTGQLRATLAQANAFLQAHGLTEELAA